MFESGDAREESARGDEPRDVGDAVPFDGVPFDGVPVEPVEVAGPVAAWETDPDVLTPGAAVDALVAVQAQRARLDAAEAALLVRAAGATRVVRDVLVEDIDPETGLPVPDREARVVGMRDEVVEEIAAALRRSPDQVRSQVDTARLLHGPLRATLDALGAGRITYAHASAVTAQASRLMTMPLGEDPAADRALTKACTALQDRVLPYADRETPGETRARARRVVVSIDPAGAAARRRRAKLHCDVTGRALDDGLALIEAVLPAIDAATVLSRVDATARGAVTSGAVEDLGLGADATFGQVRAAVFARLITSGELNGNSDGGSRGRGRTRVEVGVLIDAVTLTGLTPDGPAWVQVGREQAETSRTDLLDLLDRSDVDVTFRRLVCDRLTGALVDRGANTYRATAALRAWLVARDRHCTHPGCTRPAWVCDVDHATDFRDGGKTTITDTRLLCRRHHNGKTHGGWQITDTQPDGSCVFISPTGRHYRHAPARLLPEPPLPPTVTPAHDENLDPPPF